MDDAYHIHHASRVACIDVAFAICLGTCNSFVFKWTSPQTVYSVVLLLYKYELIRTRWIHVYE